MINHNTTRDSRPKSQSLFLLKSRERLLDLNVREKVAHDNVSGCKMDISKSMMEMTRFEVASFLKDYG